MVGYSAESQRYLCRVGMTHQYNPNCQSIVIMPGLYYLSIAAESLVDLPASPKSISQNRQNLYYIEVEKTGPWVSLRLRPRARALIPKGKYHNNTLEKAS